MICIVVFIIVGYNHLRSNLKPIIAEWPKQRCNPAVIPFAGWINSDRGDGKGALEYTGENFAQCTQTILEEITAYAFMPIYYIMQTFTAMFKELSDAVNNARHLYRHLYHYLSNPQKG